MDSGDSLTSIMKTPELPPPSTGSARQSVQLPRNWAEMIERWKEGNVRDVVMKAIETYVMVYAAQVREEKTGDGRTVPILARSKTGNELVQFAQIRNVPPAALVRVGASLVVNLLSEQIGDETLFDLIAQRAEASQRKFVDEVALLLREALRRRQ